LVLNHGQRYSVDIRGKELIETFCVFFKPGFMEGVREGLQQNWDGLLGAPAAVDRIGFYERLNPTDDLVSPQVAHLEKLVRRGQGSELEANETMMRIAEALLRNQNEATRQRESLDLAKNSTRDFMIANLEKPADLAAIAATATLSPFHFHRLFKSAFRQTPHEFLTAQRIVKAKGLLRNSARPMHEIAWAVGMESAAAFSKLFARTTGMSPSAFRTRVLPR
jgi:AraC-like DNA-binding protein